MSYQPIPVTDRILAARELVRTLTVGSCQNPYADGEYRMFCTGDRFVTTGFLESWMKNKNAATTRLRRSLAEADELYASKPVIYDVDLLAGRLDLPHHTAEEQARYDELCDKMEASPFALHTSGARKDHITLDFDKLLTVGLDAIIADLKARIAESENSDAPLLSDFEPIRKEEFWRCCLIELEAVLDLARRYSEKATSLAETAAEPRRSELLRMARALEKVPAKPAETFFEALQSVHFFLSNLFGLYPLGRPDRYLLPYYEKDLAEGRLTREEAQELIDFFCLGISDRVFSRAACGFIVGGVDRDGNLVENDLTYAFITALDHIRMSDPNGALAVSPKTSDELMSYAVRVLADGVTHPAFYNDEAIVSSLKRYGVSDEDAVNYIHSTCAEITAAGKTRGHTTAFTVDLPRVLVDTVRVGPSADFDSLLAAYETALTGIVKRAARRYVSMMLEAGRNGNEQMRVSSLIDDCIERGRSISEGGAKYQFIQPIFVGFANAVDSLEAIRSLCFEKKELTLPDFLTVIDADFEGNETLRRFIVNSLPHYGNDNAKPDALAAKLAAVIERAVFSQKAVEGFLMPGTFSYITHASLGSHMQATFDGRKAGLSYADGCCPAQGRDVTGPTALINSLTSWDQSRFLAGMVVNVKFAKSTFSPEKQKLLVSLVRAFMMRGGIEIQINSVDPAVLEDALIHPEDHGDLLVRIGGYSDYFVRLTPALQKEVIARTSY